MIIKYTYDAAGRMVKEGAKSYRYGYLDKVMSMTEGKNRITYGYHVDGQLATVTKGNVTEEFIWDGLALVKRGTTSYVNEPHPGGGAPVASSNGSVRFNDILGATLGVSGNDCYVSSSKTAFGDAANGQLPTTNFFTGKPHVDGLGHAFLLRNYHADLGKLPTADPLGYPDGWNQMAYCNGKVISCIDFMGADIYHVADSEGAIAGTGHSAWIIGDDENGYTAYDYQANGLSGSGVSGSSSDGETRMKDGFGTLQDALNYLSNFLMPKLQ